MNRLHSPAISGLISHEISVQAAAWRSGVLPFGRISEAPPIGAALRTLFGRNATLYGAFILSRTKLNEPVDNSIMPSRPAKNALVQALASLTPGGITFALLTSVSTRVNAPKVLGAL